MAVGDDVAPREELLTTYVRAPGDHGVDEARPPPAPPPDALMVTAPVEPEMLMFDPATIEVTPEFAIVPVKGLYVMPVPPLSAVVEAKGASPKDEVDTVPVSPPMERTPVFVMVLPVPTALNPVQDTPDVQETDDVATFDSAPDPLP